jgi:hypothetical protein
MFHYLPSSRSSQDKGERFLVWKAHHRLEVGKYSTDAMIDKLGASYGFKIVSVKSSTGMMKRCELPGSGWKQRENVLLGELKEGV